MHHLVIHRQKSFLYVIDNSSNISSNLQHKAAVRLGYGYIKPKVVMTRNHTCVEQGHRELAGTKSNKSFHFVS